MSEANFTFMERDNVVSGASVQIDLDPLHDATVLLIDTASGGNISLAYAIKENPASGDFVTEIDGSEGTVSVAFVGRGVASIKVTVNTGTYKIQVRQTPYALR